MLQALRVAVVGPESSGKTTLVQALGIRLQQAGVKVACVDEFARTYYAHRPYLPTLSDIDAIALGQCALEDEAAADADIVLCDTNALTCRIWAEVAFGAASETVLRLCQDYHYGLILLAHPDIPWQADPLRSHPEERDYLFALYREALLPQGGGVAEVCGPHEQRLQQSWAALARQGAVVLTKI
ncbi:AAA family ATPase [Craterilacuibacter sp.]|uniref:AAA family ATPase n=1 Tax=Craterilacuibacter sp. TaxID=2870909 RepID=UPI003F3AA5EE